MEPADEFTIVINLAELLFVVRYQKCSLVG
jgi:hypothetical protein